MKRSKPGQSRVEPEAPDRLQTRVYGDPSRRTLIYLPGLHGDWTLVGSFRKALGGRVRFVEITYPRTTQLVARGLCGECGKRTLRRRHPARLVARRILQFPGRMAPCCAETLSNRGRHSGRRLCATSHSMGCALCRTSRRQHSSVVGDPNPFPLRETCPIPVPSCSGDIGEYQRIHFAPHGAGPPGRGPPVASHSTERSFGNHRAPGPAGVCVERLAGPDRALVSRAALAAAALPGPARISGAGACRP